LAVALPQQWPRPGQSRSDEQMMSPAPAMHESGDSQVVEGGKLVDRQQACPGPHETVSRQEIEGPTGHGWSAGRQVAVVVMRLMQQRCSPAVQVWPPHGICKIGPIPVPAVPVVPPAPLVPAVPVVPPAPLVPAAPVVPPAPLVPAAPVVPAPPVAAGSPSVPTQSSSLRPHESATAQAASSTKAALTAPARS
jgi:hypothetical protein